MSNQFVSSFVSLNKRQFKIVVDKKSLIKKRKNYLLSEKYGSDKLQYLDWYKEGYKVIDVFNTKEHLTNKKIIRKNLKKILKHPNNKIFNIDKYHKHVDDKKHLKVIKKTRELNPKIFNKIKKKIFSKIYEEFKISFKKNKILKKEIAILRLNRPGGQYDMNPPHRDGYLNYWSKSLNIWYMISGSYKTCALPIIPKSHLIKENKLTLTRPFSKMNGVQYHVPTIIKINNKKKIYFKIPKIKPGQVLIFSPFLIHGFGYNFSPNLSRIALELRPEIS